MNAWEWIICAFVTFFILRAAWRWISARLYESMCVGWEVERAERARVAKRLVAEYYTRQIEDSHNKRSE